jgi:hypothetical protein
MYEMMQTFKELFLPERGWAKSAENLGTYSF